MSKPQLLMVDQETANTIREIAQKTNASPAELVKIISGLLKYAMGRKVKIEGKKHIIEMNGFEKYSKLVDLDE